MLNDNKETDNSQENIQYLNFTKEEIEKAGGYIKVKENGEFNLFIPKKFLYNKINIFSENNKKNYEPKEEDEEDWGEKSL